MPLVSSTIPNLINGVSQQADAFRLPSQATLQENAYSSVVEGLKNRPPTEHIAKIVSGDPGSVFLHTINRDPSERYVVLVENGDLRVFDLAGTEQTVNFPDGKGYLSASDPSTAFRATTIKDFTFLVNTTTTAAMDSTADADLVPSAIVSIDTGHSNREYRIFINGTEQAFRSSSGDTDTIAENLHSDLVSNLGTTDWTLEYETNSDTIYIAREDGADFDIRLQDGAGGGFTTLIKNRANQFADLPERGYVDMLVEIEGDAEANEDNFWVKFVPDDSNDTGWAAGAWEETAAPGIVNSFDSATLPHQLVRESDGTFTFEQVNWGKRTAGDADTAPDPSFIGQKISSIFFFQSRLGLTAGENVVFSRIDEFFDFFPSTVTVVLDENPIDSVARHTRAVNIHGTAAMDETLVLFSDQTQFFVRGEDILTTKTISITPKTEYESQTTAEPIAVGRNLYFAFPNGSFSGINEYTFDDRVDTSDALDVTANVPKYINGDITKIAGTTLESALVVLADGEKSSAWVYKFLFEGRQRVQSSWSKFKFRDDILNADFIESTLYLVLKRSDGLYLESIDLAPDVTDPGAEYLTHLDRRITENDCQSVAYDSGADETTFTLPYAIDGADMAIVGRTNDPQGDLAPGDALTIKSEGTNTLVVSGDHTGDNVWIGHRYTMRYRLSTLYIRENQRRGSSIPITTGKLQVRNVTFDLSATGLVKVEVTPTGSTTYEYVFNGNSLGSGGTVIGNVNIEDGTFRVPIMSSNTNVTIDIVNDTFLPCHVLSATFEALFFRRSRGV